MWDGAILATPPHVPVDICADTHRFIDSQRVAKIAPSQINYPRITIHERGPYGPC